ncbi:MAG: SDR family oxidoreductase [Thermoleophilia bacterium]
MILVTGATGTVGRELVRELAGRGVAVRALVRSPERAAALHGLDVELAWGSLEDARSVAAALDGVETAFLLTGVPENQLELQNGFVDAAIGAGVAHLVKLGVMHPALDHPVGFFRWHRETELRIERSGLGWAHVRPNNFFQNLLFQAEGIRRDGVFRSCFGQGRVSSVDARDVAAVSAAVLRDPSRWHGRALDVTGPAAPTHDEMLAALSHALGRDVRYVDLAPEEFEAATLAGGAPAFFARDLTLLARSLAAGAASEVTDVVAETTGRPARSIDDFARDYADSFR